MASIISLYDILEVPDSAAIDEIKTAFRRLAKIHHPDISDTPESVTAFIIIHNAYETLSNPKKRNEYDFYLDSIKPKGRREGGGVAVKHADGSGIHAFTLEELLSHINSFLWDIEIFLTKDYEKNHDRVLGGKTVKEYILHLLMFIDKWILYPAGICDYFLQSRQIEDIDYFYYINKIDETSGVNVHRPFYSLDNYFYDIRKRIDKFMNKATVNDVNAFIPDRDVRLIDCIIEAQNYIIYVMGSLKRALAGDDEGIRPYEFSRAVFRQ